ncbi:HlyC/CorC family transporter [Nocardia higoensis]|uniref:HlyC/CorC family transporter n=1 Tax=Nocardia higoensis TaxID=228599 RepID=A0ABS0DGX8_9NOCA|nr:hemolysin family protein [Nocardia higoensis]MBF6357728.1 HlyC/CorC family transporter [Nocardia higoensis]
MTADTVVNVLFVVVFILIGGVFAAAEIALVTLRESQLRSLERRGRRGARTAALARNPNRFLSAVQIGVTVAGFFSAAYGASTIAPDFSPVLREWGLSEEAANAVALIATTLVIAYLSLILGELVPKRLALQRTTGVSLATASPLDRFATVMSPVIWLLSVSTDALVRLLGGDPGHKGEEMTHDELRELLTGHRGIPDEERQMLAEVFDAGERSLAKVMRPRTEVDFLDADLAVNEARERAIEAGHSRYPVARSSLDDVLGFVHLRDLLRAGESENRTVAGLCRPLLQLPASKSALATLTLMRRGNTQLVLVVDEYGGTAGIATVEDIVEEIVGEIGDEFDPLPSGANHSAATGAPHRIDGLLIVEDAEQILGITLPDGPYETVAGCVLHHLQRIPQIGDSVVIEGHRFTVSDLDGKRIAALRVTPQRASAP